MQNVGVFLIRVCPMQTIGYAQFLAQRDSPRFGRQKGIRATLDNELTSVELEAIRGDLPAPTWARLEQRHLDFRKLAGRVCRGQSGNSTADHNHTCHSQPASWAVTRTSPARPRI